MRVRSVSTTAGDSRNKTRPAKVVVVANSKLKVVSRTQNVVNRLFAVFRVDFLSVATSIGEIPN